MKNLKHGDELLRQIAEGLKKISDKAPVWAVGVSFCCEGESGEIYDFSLSGALDAIASDLYRDERGSWSECRVARVVLI